jgi:ubiquinone/menaquinone biosynthesis C-methylase UbiE
MPDVPDWYRDIVVSYDTVAEQYAADYYDELSRKPFDRELLAKFASLTPKHGRVADIGCGPGHVARYLSSLGLDAIGVDISQSMIEVARRLNPGLSFEQCDMFSLPFGDASFAGISAFYSLIHIERPRVPEALGELFRVLSTGGHILLAFHAGKGEVHVDQYHSQGKQECPKVALHVTFFEIGEFEQYLEAAGFKIEESLDREPYEFEYPSRRAYILARKPDMKPE